MKCKYCDTTIPDNFIDQTCDPCWELKSRLISNYINDAKEKILNEAGWYRKEKNK